MAVEGMYGGPSSTERKAALLQQVRLAWLYAPDEVVRAANAFLEMVKEDKAAAFDMTTKMAALGELVVAVRRDMFQTQYPSKDSQLSAAEFQHIHA